MKVVKPKMKIVKRKDKHYSYWVVNSIVDHIADYYVVLSSDEWKRILQVYDAFLQLSTIAWKLAIKVITQLELELKRSKDRVQALTWEIKRLKELVEEGEEIEHLNIKMDSLAYAITVNKRYIEFYEKEIKKVRKLIEVLYEWKEKEWKALVCQDEELKEYLKVHGLLCIDDLF